MKKITTAITETKTTVSMEQWQQRIMDCQRNGMSIKAILWEDDGFLWTFIYESHCIKRLENGCFRWLRNETETKLLTEHQEPYQRFFHNTFCLRRKSYQISKIIDNTFLFNIYYYI